MMAVSGHESRIDGDNSLKGTFPGAHDLSAPLPVCHDIDPISETPKLPTPSSTKHQNAAIPERLPWKNIFLLHSILQLWPAREGYFISWVFKFFKITTDDSLTRGALVWGKHSAW